jgi:hypothetical protein
MTGSRREPSHRWSACIAALAVVVLAIPGSAQQRVGTGGRALDANLQLGSGGYNRPTSSGVMMAKPLYKVGQSGEMRYDASAAFGRPRRFEAPRSVGAYNIHPVPDATRQPSGGQQQPIAVRSPQEAREQRPAWQPTAYSTFMPQQTYRPAGPSRPDRRSERQPLALGSTSVYQPGATSNPYGVNALFGN